MLHLPAVQPKIALNGSFPPSLCFRPRASGWHPAAGHLGLERPLRGGNLVGNSPSQPDYPGARFTTMATPFCRFSAWMDPPKLVTYWLAA